MISHDYECQSCKKITEHYVDSDNIPDQILCPVCNNIANKVFLSAKSSMVNASWLCSVLEVVEKGSEKQHCNEFLKNPTRSNYGKWLKKEGIRHLESGERLTPAPPPPEHIITEKLLEKRRERVRIEIRS